MTVHSPLLRSCIEIGRHCDHFIDANPQATISRRIVHWRATVDEDAHYCRAVPYDAGTPSGTAGQAAFGLFTVSMRSRILPRSRFAI
jgi:hypothetical protein